MKDYKIIKDKYGENMAKLCRELFPSLLEKEGLLSSLILSKFAHNHHLYDDIINSSKEDKFKNYIYSFVDVEKKDLEVNKTVKELMSDAGYYFYECHNEDDIQMFKKYYAKGEALCTFKGNRLKSCYVFWAVKKNIDDIKRNNYSTPERQNEYGTSVISIQFSRGDNNTLSIKNRYNHTVNNPDATFSNNLENIIPGLTSAFEREYGLHINQNKSKEFELDGYVLADDGKYYKSNYEFNDIYYCPNNTIIDHGEVIRLDTSRYILIDYFIVDLKEKRIRLHDYQLNDCFEEIHKNIEKIEVLKNRETKEKTINILSKNKEPIIIKIDNLGRILSYKNHNLTKVNDSFLAHNTTLRELDTPNIEEVGMLFLTENKNLTSLYLPKIKKANMYFLDSNKKIAKIYAPNIEIVKNYFLTNAQITELSSPNLKIVGDYFLSNNRCLDKIEVPNLEKVGNNFLYSNDVIKSFFAPELKEVGSNFLAYAINLESLDTPKLKSARLRFLQFNQKIKSLFLPCLERVSDDFMKTNKILSRFEAYNIKEIGDNFLEYNNNLETLSFPKLEIMGSLSLSKNQSLKYLDIPDNCKLHFGILEKNPNCIIKRQQQIKNSKHNR